MSGRHQQGWGQPAAHPGTAAICSAQAVLRDSQSTIGGAMSRDGMSGGAAPQLVQQ